MKHESLNPAAFGTTNQKVFITALGYQYPELANHDYDSNWLNTQIEVKHPVANWNAIEPVLLTSELGELIIWLKSIVNNPSAEPSIGFIEPNLKFEYLGENDGKFNLSVILSAEYLPDDVSKRVQNPSGDDFDGFPINVSMTKEEVLKATTELEDQFLKYPPRSGWEVNLDASGGNHD